jgi:sugar lactone lactonase YvrE
MDLVSLLTTTSKATGNPNAWDISKAYYDAGADAWDISKAFYSGPGFSVAAQDTSPSDVFFKPDGTKMYVLGDTGDDVNEYTLSTPWLVTSASYVQNFSVSSQDTVPEDLFFRADGLRMYVTGRTNDSVYEYHLTSAWDISTASYVQSFSVATEETGPTGLFFKPDGTKMYIAGRDGDEVNEYDLSTAWDISSASYVQAFSVAGQETLPNGLSFKPDGTKMYIIGATGDDINEYDLSTPWDISTASYVQNFAMATGSAPTGLFFKEDGSTFYTTDNGLDTVVQYPIGGFSVAAQETSPQDLFFKPDGTKMYVVGATGDDVNEYDLSTAWDILSASYLQNFSVATEETSPTGLFFKPDGTKMYICGTSGDDVNEYSLSTPWDVSSASYVQNFSVSTQDGQPQALFFKPDGTKMYVVGAVNDGVYEYDLSTPWDVSSSSYLQSFSVASQVSTPGGLFFKPDGTKMYVCGAATESIIAEYSLSSAWDVSTASYVQDLNISAQETGLGVATTGLFWKDDGEQFWTSSASSDKVFSYLISPE